MKVTLEGFEEELLEPRGQAYEEAVEQETEIYTPHE
ncbi:hypothetical protein A2U01_0070608, partial [Trifolium medium]|nr:hypothetical protein [Trifolium medium]